MTEPNPYQPIPVDIPAGHPMLDTAGFTDARAVAGRGLSLAAALEVIKSAGYTVAEAEAALRAFGQADIRNAAPGRRSPQDPDHRCHRCQAPATVQWPRLASAEEAEAWHAGREQHIRAANDGRDAAGYVSDRTDTVTLAVHGCEQHDLSPAPFPHDSGGAMAAKQIGAKLRALTHDADCGGHGACQCGGDRG